MKIVSCYDIDSKAWDKFVETSSQAWLYHKFYWQLQHLKKANFSFAVIDENNANSILAICPLFLHTTKSRLVKIFIIGIVIKLFLKILKKYRIKHLETGYSGPAIANISAKRRRKVEKFLFDHIDQIAKQEKAVRCEIRLDAGCNLQYKYNPLWHYGYIHNLSFLPRLNCVLDLTKSEEQLLMEMEEDCRSIVRKAQRENFDVDIGNCEDIAKRFFNLFIKAQERIRGEKYLAEFQRFKTYFMDNFTTDNNIIFVVVKNKKQDVSAVALHLFKNQVLYFRAGSDEEYFKYGVNNFALWQAIKYSKKMGYKIFNVGTIYPSKPLINESNKLYKEQQKEYSTGEYKKQFSNILYPAFEGIKLYN